MGPATAGADAERQLENQVNIRRFSAAALVSAALLVPVAACGANGTGTADGTPDPATSSSPAIPADPKQALLDSTREISKGNFRFTMSAAGATATGMVHQPSRSAQMTMKFGQPSDDIYMNLDLIYVEPDSWVKTDLGGTALRNVPGAKDLSSDKYYHIDKTKAEGIKDLQFDFQQVDPAGSDLLTKAVVDVKATGDRSYSGTIDLSKAPDAGLVDADVVKALGAEASKLPFQARLDEQGRLSELVIQVPAAGQNQAQELKVTYSDYGAATTPTKPAPGQTQEAPAVIYDLFRN
ncbi:MAG TPA: hypothetical protein VGD43_03840 [Micromonospora sp.]